MALSYVKCKFMFPYTLPADDGELGTTKGLEVEENYSSIRTIWGASSAEVNCMCPIKALF